MTSFKKMAFDSIVGLACRNGIFFLLNQTVMFEENKQYFLKNDTIFTLRKVKMQLKMDNIQ